MTTPNEGVVTPQGSADENVETVDTNVAVADPKNIQLGDTPAPEVTKPETPKPEDNTGVFGDAGDPAMNLVYRFIEKNGFKPEDAEIQSVLNTGDFSLLRAKLASMGDKAAGWQEYIGIAERHFKSESDKQLAQIASCEQAIHSTVGGKEQWLEIQAWASANADPHEKEAFNALLSAGPLQAKAAARQLAEYYNNAMGTVKTPSNSVSDKAQSQPAGNSYSLSPQEYVAAVLELSRKVGSGRIDDHPEYAKLKQRRAAWRG